MSEEHTKERAFDRCAECRMLVNSGEYHPYTACVLYKQLGQADKVTSCLNSVIEHARASVAAPRGDAYVAWCRYTYDNEGCIRSIVTCDSDAKGAFKVYRASPGSPSPTPEQERKGE